MSEKSYSGHIGFTNLLLLAFIILKLCGVITWSWWWVMSPLWIPVALFLIIMLVVWIAAILLH